MIVDIESETTDQVPVENHVQAMVIRVSHVTKESSVVYVYTNGLYIENTSGWL
jgi:hypothetical protein